LNPAQTIAGTAIEAGGKVVVTSSLESGIGLAAGAHLASSLPGSALDQGLSTGLLFEEDLVTPSLLPVRGILNTPSAPGLGVKLSAVSLEKHGTEIRGEVKA
jgi:muconate cycloisomerase